MHRIRILAIAAIVFSSASACGTTDPEADDGTTLVVIDSDGAFDDIKAILYLLEQPNIEVLAMTVSGTGIAHCPVAAENLSALLERIRAPDIPVACGRSTPLAGDNEAPPAWRSSADTLGAVALPEPRPLASSDAPELLAETLEESPRNVTLVALGPLTNIAEAVTVNPDLLAKVDILYLMGGAVDVGGNVLYGNAAAEFNIWADPKAAEIVFATEVPITLVPLDATNDLPVTPYLYEAVAAHRDASPVAAFLADYLDATPFFGGIYHWDELAAVAATDQSVVTLENRTLSITTGPEGAEGVTHDDPNGRTVTVAVGADRAQFERHFYGALLGTVDPGVAEWKPDAILSWDGTTCSYDGPDPLPDEFFVRLDNESDGLVALVTGVYNAGTTRADFEAAVAAATPGAPDWWLPSAQIVAAAGGHEVWTMRGGTAITALCWVDPTRVWEIAGPRLPDS